MDLFDIFKSNEQKQSIKNSHVLRQLQQYGDTLEKEREVFHWIYFKAVDDRSAFIEKIKKESFTIVAQNKIDNAKDGRPYSLQIKRIDRVDHNSIDACTIYLLKTAEETQGDYDGWETSVEKI
jgi:regulator of RNase E activity RraB